MENARRTPPASDESAGPFGKSLRDPQDEASSGGSAEDSAAAPQGGGSSEGGASSAPPAGFSGFEAGRPAKAGAGGGGGGGGPPDDEASPDEDEPGSVVNPFSRGDHRFNCFRYISVSAAWAEALEAFKLTSPCDTRARRGHDMKWMNESQMIDMLIILAVSWKPGSSFDKPSPKACYSLNKLAHEMVGKDAAATMSNTLRGNLLPVAARCGLICGFPPKGDLEKGAGKGNKSYEIHLSEKGLELILMYDRFLNRAIGD